MKKIFLLFIGISSFLTLKSQDKVSHYQLSGQVTEKITGNGVPFATVIISNDSIKLKKAQACDVSGRFSFDLNTSARYNITISSVGFKEFTMPIKISSFKTDLGKIQIEEGVLLKEVTVTAQKPLVKVDPDKIVYSIEADPDAQANNALDMLRKVPLITVDAEENITMNGQSNFKVLVNGKSSSMMSTNFKEALKSMPANSIKDIEVITNPSSKYDAEGVGGIINIITNKKTLSGYNGSISTGFDARGSLNLSAYLAIKIKKLSFSSRYYGNQIKQPDTRTSSETEYFNNPDFSKSNSNSDRDFKGISNGFTGEASYEIDSLNLLSMSFWGSQMNYENTGFTGTQYMNSDNVITRLYENHMYNKYKYGYLSGNIDYQRTYKKPDKSLTISYKLENDPVVVKNSSIIEGLINYPSYNQLSKNEAIGREQTIQADYYNPITQKHQLEGGLKFILRQNTSNSEVLRDNISLDNVNDLDYNQYILGLYAGYLIKWKKVSTKTGLRLERTWNDGKSETSGIITDFTNRLVNLVPYVTFSFMPKQGRTFKLSYTQRLSRPGIWYLNPYVNNTDSLNISYGNPKLESEISHSFELGYTYFTPKLNFSTSLNSSFENNSIQSISKVEHNGATVTTYENIGKNQLYGFNIYLSYRPSSKLNLYINGGGNYRKIEAVTSYVITNKGFNYRGSLGARQTIWKDGSVTANLGIYSSDIMLQGKSSSYYYTSLSLSQYFLKRKLMLNLSTSDPFWPRKKYTAESGDITFSSHIENSYPAQNFRLSVSYNFGKMALQVKKARRGINNDDLKGGGNSQGGSVQQQ
jgi:outer membrane receptor protein involved in Fe transport